MNTLTEARRQALCAALSAPPSAESWESLCGILHTLTEDEDLESILAFCEERLSAFPDVLRVCPEPWRRALIAGEREPRIRLVRHLCCDEGSIDREGFLRLSDGPLLEGITHLSIERCPLGNPSIASYAASSAAASLLGLRLVDVGIDSAAVAALGASRSLTKLVELDLRDNPIGVVGAKTLACAPFLEQLRALLLCGTGIGVSGLSALTAARLSCLEELWLGDLELGAEGIGALVEAPDLGALRILRLMGSMVGDEGARKLAAFPGLARLEVLELMATGIGDEGAMALAQSPYLGSIAIDLRDNAIGDRGAMALASSPRLAQVALLHLQGNPLSEEAKTQLRASPGAHVVHLS